MQSGAKPFKKHQPIPPFFPPHLDLPPVPIWRFLVSHLWRDPHQTELGDDSCSLRGLVRKTNISFFVPLRGEVWPSWRNIPFTTQGKTLRGCLGACGEVVEYNEKH